MNPYNNPHSIHPKMLHTPSSPYGNPIEFQDESLYKSLGIQSFPLESLQRSLNNPNAIHMEGPCRRSYRTRVFEWQVTFVGPIEINIESP